ncbi:MAG: hypothetical protein WA825_18940, partial [Steroidobacteraceae bacterium]
MSRVFRVLQWRPQWLLALVWVAAGLSGCVIFREPITTPVQPVQPPGAVNPGTANAYPAAPI